MKVIGFTGKDDLAIAYIAKMEEEKFVEFVESVEPPIPREKKWVLIISTLYGCPIKCPICDAGGYYKGKLTKEEIFAQIDFLIKKRFPDRAVPVDKFKIQFARMGEPSFNTNVLEVLEELPLRYNAPGLMPCISTIAPLGTDKFFEKLVKVKNKFYRGRFQLQFSIHTTNDKLRDWLIPVKKWDFAKIAQYGRDYHEKGDRKITLNFALVKNALVDHRILLKYFSPDIFLIKITPVNPTYQVTKNKLSSYIDPYNEGKDYPLVRELRAAGYEVIISVGEVEENLIGSNCGQFLLTHLKNNEYVKGGYKYKVQEYL